LTASLNDIFKTNKYAIIKHCPEAPMMNFMSFCVLLTNKGTVRISVKVMKVGGGKEIGLHSFLTGALVEKSGQLKAPANLPLGRELPITTE